MSVKIRLARFGRKKAPYFRLVVADHHFPRDGRFIETIGSYQPLKPETKVEIDEERALSWLGKGAIPSDTVRSLFRQKGILKKYHELRIEERKRTSDEKSKADA